MLALILLLCCSTVFSAVVKVDVTTSGRCLALNAAVIEGSTFERRLHDALNLSERCRLTMLDANLLHYDNKWRGLLLKHKICIGESHTTDATVLLSCPDSIELLAVTVEVRLIREHEAMNTRQRRALSDIVAFVAPKMTVDVEEGNVSDRIVAEVVATHRHHMPLQYSFTTPTDTRSERYFALDYNTGTVRTTQPLDRFDFRLISLLV